MFPVIARPKRFCRKDFPNRIEFIRVHLHLVEAQGRTFFGLAKVVDGDIDGDPVGPRGKAGITSEAGHGAEGADESFLQEVGGVVVIGRHVVDGGVEAALVALYELVECGGISGLDSGDKGLIRFLGWITGFRGTPGRRCGVW